MASKTDTGKSERRIASNLLWTPRGVVHNPLVSFSAEGRPLHIETCTEPDRQAATEFHAGLLVLDFPADYRAAFVAMQAEDAPLTELLPHYVPADGGVAVVLSGLDYDALRLTPQSVISVIY